MRLLVHMAVPDVKRTDASGMAGLSGLAAEFSVELEATGGDAVAWAAFKGYSNKYWGASQALVPEVVQAMMADGYSRLTEVFFAAYYEDTLLPVPGGCNMTNWPDEPTFDSFLACGSWVKVLPEGLV